MNTQQYFDLLNNINVSYKYNGRILKNEERRAKGTKGAKGAKGEI